MQFYVSDPYLTQLQKKYDHDAGLDIASAEELIIQPHQPASVRTCLHVAVPKGYAGLVWSRSGTSFNDDIETGAGCVDYGYTGEVKVKLYNHGDKPFKITKGQRIAQFLTVKIDDSRYTQVKSLEDLGAFDRGEAGFGSTGQ